MMAKILALVALAALATANGDDGGACTVVTITPTTTTTAPTSTSTTTSVDDCHTRTICIDNVNECGLWYGGCIPDCKPYPTFSKPPCPPTTTTTTTSVPTTSTTSADDCHTRTICIDHVNECGLWYGGCIPDCKPYPTFSKPPCPSTTTLLTILSPTASK
ncbi:hypothetical protein LLEC1_02797 [Akanthomyces lecanii]|uniref:Uncharacterized protein n=1 Tax=Cordyceps confragosa TaxID=2714763 RepID=A0A179IE40_CORDF|nr:hypothetical protein LLEC1_02797 [Akanthomyces lecanii]